MSVNGNTNLAAAIAAVQASLPKLNKGETGEVKGVTKDGKPFSYTYKYADLAEVSHAILPALGANGLAFIAKPTITEGGGFALAYSLLHSSGEREDGIYPLPATGTPQQIGSAITYARRYCLCAVTGIAPAQEDDDGAAANTSQQYARQPSAGEAFESARPARQGNGRRSISAEDIPPPDDAARGTISRPAAAPRPPAATGEPDPDAQPYADEALEARTVAALRPIHIRAREAHKLAALIRNPSTGGIGGLGAYMNWKKAVLEKAETALAALEAAGKAAGLSRADLDAEVLRQAGKSIEDATAEDMEKVTAVLSALVTA